MAEQPYQPLNISTGSAQQAIQSQEIVTPNLAGLMTSIKEGFISADDIRRRVQSGPLEAATRKEALTNVQQVQPLQRQAAVAELQNLQAKQQFEAQSLPIMNATKRANLEQAHNNALQFGAPEEILKIFYASVPNFIPFDPDKLHDKKTGQVNVPYANEMIIKAKQEARKMELSAKFTGPVAQKTTDASGKTTETQTIMNTLTGQPVGVPVVTSTAVPNAAEAEAKAKAASAGLSNDFLAERNRSDTLKRFGPQLSSFDAIDAIRNRGTPPKNADDLAILYQFITVLDPESVVREGEKKFAESTAPGAQALWNRVQGLWSDSNRTMDVDTRNNLYATIDTLKTGAETSVRPELKRLSNLALDRGVPLSQALTEPELKLLVNGPTTPGKPSPAVPGVAPTVGAAGPSVPPPVIDITDREAAAAQAKALPANIPFFKWSGSEDLFKNPNYRP